MNCDQGKCVPVRHNLIILFDTSSSMTELLVRGRVHGRHDKLSAGPMPVAANPAKLLAELSGLMHVKGTQVCDNGP